MKQEIINELEGKKILILGFGREGQSTYSFIQKNVKYAGLGIADKKEIVLDDNNVTLHTGENYLDSIKDYDIIIKTPGISLKDIDITGIKEKITSQTDLFIKYGRDKIIGVTGTKGKSTTSSLIYYMLINSGKNAKLIGNIGVPAFESIDDEPNIDSFVYELSAHQLEYLHKAPHIGVLLNLFEEHLDHFGTLQKYENAKLNILRLQTKLDYAIYGASIKEKVQEIESTSVVVGEGLKEENNTTIIEGKNIISNIDEKNLVVTFPEDAELQGKHNIFNSMIAISVANILNLDKEIVKNSLKTFKTLPYRLQKIGIYNNIEYVDDSISTIPEATIAAIETLKNVGTVLVGGMDRGIDYDILVKYINEHKNITYILMYESGKRIYDNVQKTDNVIYTNDLSSAVMIAKQRTKANTICLLSPAAASYGPFKNFEERGDKFKEYIKSN